MSEFEIDFDTDSSDSSFHLRHDDTTDHSQSSLAESEVTNQFSNDSSSLSGNSSQQNENDDMSSRASEHSSQQDEQGSVMSEETGGSDDTEPYDVDDVFGFEDNEAQDDGSIIVIGDTQPAAQNIDDDDDDDVILIPQHIETIDLCTQPLLPVRLTNNHDVIEISDSPVPRNNRNREGRPMRNSTRNDNTSTPYHRNVQSPPKASTSVQSTTNNSLDDSQTMPTQQVKITCPICFDSVINRNPQSTSCGHIFCKSCLMSALNTAKKCPLCRKPIRRGGYHNIHLG